MSLQYPTQFSSIKILSHQSDVDDSMPSNNAPDVFPEMILIIYHPKKHIFLTRKK